MSLRLSHSGSLTSLAELIVKVLKDLLNHGGVWPRETIK